MLSQAEYSHRVRHFYRQFRGNMERPAEVAYASARSHVHFLERLRKMVEKPRRKRKH